MSAGVTAATPDYRPRFPETRPAVAILGCGQIANTAHLPAYQKAGVEVAGVWSLDETTTAGIQERFPGVGTVYRDGDELLADPRVGIVDIATGPAGRVEWIAKAIAAGKHVLTQKPLISDPADLPALEEALAEAARRGLRVAVNQNARWAPAWRLVTLLIRDGAIGDVVGVTHLHDKPLPPIAGTPFDDVEHMLISDYLVHWVDITRCWLEGSTVETVAAHDSRVPGQPETARNPWHATIHLGCTDGATALLRVVGNAKTRTGGCPFWVHGTEGTLRGSILLGSDRVVLERGDTTTSFALEGQWFVDGFAGTMGELMSAIDEDREPENSAAHVLASVRTTFAAVESVRAGGAVVRPTNLELTRARALL